MRLLARVLLVLLMALGSVTMWIAVPIGWLWLAARLTRGSTTGFGPYLLVLAGIVASVVVLAKALAALNRAYGRVTGSAPRVRVQLPWHRSLRGERGSGREPSVLDVVMVASVSLALAAMTIWFFGFAGSSVPT